MITLLLVCLLQDPVDTLFKKLASDDIEEREAASRELAERARKDPAVLKRLTAEAAAAKSPELQGRLAATLLAVEWASSPNVPVPPRNWSYSMSDGKRLVFWGGNDGKARRTDGVLYENGAWKALPAAEIEGRVLPTLVLSGDHFVVWSGAQNTYLEDGAVYDLARGTVRTIPAAPMAGRVRPAVVDLGNGRLLFWGGEVDLNDVLQAENPVQIMWRKPTYPGDGAVLDLKTLAWTKVAASPLKGRNVRPAWTGTELVVAGGFVEKDMMGRSNLVDAAAYDPAKDAWRGLPDVPLKVVAKLQATSKGVLAWGAGGALLENGKWTQIAEPPAKAQLHGVAKDRVLLWANYDKQVGSMLDLKTMAWTEIPKCPLASRVYAQAHWDGDVLRVWGGHTPGEPRKFFKDGATWTVGADRWRASSEPPLEVDKRLGYATSWSGRYLVYWGGITPGEGKGGWASPVKVFEDASIHDAVADSWRLVPKSGPLAPWIGTPEFFWIDGKLLIVAADLSRAVVWKP